MPSATMAWMGAEGATFVLGTAQLRTRYGIQARNRADPSASDGQAVLRTAAQLGVDALDTAPGYGAAEETIGAVGGPWRVHTKVHPGVEPATSLQRSLELLGRDEVDLLYLHDATEVVRVGSAVVAAAHELVGHGAARLGASIYDLEQFDAAVADPRIGAVQVPASVFDRRIDDRRLRAAVDAGVEVYVRSVLLQGVLATSSDRLAPAVAELAPYVDRFRKAAEQLGRPVIEVAIGWARALPGVRGIVVGAESPADLEELIAHFDRARLDDDELDILRQLEPPPPALCDPRRWHAGPAEP